MEIKVITLADKEEIFRKRQALEEIERKKRFLANKLRRAKELETEVQSYFEICGGVVFFNKCFPSLYFRGRLHHEYYFNFKNGMRLRDFDNGEIVLINNIKYLRVNKHPFKMNNKFEIFNVSLAEGNKIEENLSKGYLSGIEYIQDSNLLYHKDYLDVHGYIINLEKGELVVEEMSSIKGFNTFKYFSNKQDAENAVRNLLQNIWGHSFAYLDVHKTLLVYNDASEEKFFINVADDFIAEKINACDITNKACVLGKQISDAWKEKEAELERRAEEIENSSSDEFGGFLISLLICSSAFLIYLCAIAK